MLVMRPLLAWFLVTGAVAGAANLRQGRRSLQTYTQSDDYFSVMLDRVNQARASEGRPLLCTNKKLQNAAQQHSDDQAAHEYMDHTGTDGTNIEDRVAQADYNWSSVAENVAAGQPDVDAVMEAWMNSPGHRENILGNYTMFGTAYAYNADSTYKHYWTQDFGTGDAEECDGGSVAAETESTVADLIESSEAEDTSTETGGATTDEPVMVVDQPEMVTTSELLTKSSYSDSSWSVFQQEADVPCTDAPVVVVDSPVTESPTEGSDVEDGSVDGYEETDTPVVVVDPPEIGTTAEPLTDGSEGSTSQETLTIELPEETPVVVVDPPEIGTPAPEKEYKTNDTPTTQVINKPHHGKDCTSSL